MKKIISVLDNIVYFHIDFIENNNGDKIFHIGGIKIKNEKPYYYEEKIFFKEESLKNPWETSEYNKGISNKRCLEALKEFLEDLPLLCHGDELMLKRLKIIGQGSYINNNILDSKELIALLNPTLKNYSLEGLKSHIEARSPFQSKVMGDVYLILELVNKFLSDFWMENPLVIPREFENLRTWPWYSYIHPKNIAIESKEIYKEEEESEKNSKVNYKEYEGLFRNEKLWKKHHSNYTIRENQVKLSGHIKEGILKRNITLVEAPTGIGKSMAYVLPSSIFCNLNKDKKVFISTNTKGLQRQLVTKDIPNLLKVLNLPNIKYVLIKGKSNYFCIDRLNYLDKDFIEDNPLGYVYIYRYINDYGLGDIEEVDSYIREKFNLNNLIPHCFCDSELCNIEECPHDERCYYAKKVRSLEEGNIVVINHSLLLRWPYENYAKIEHLIMDEAHNLSDEAYSAYEEEVNTLDIYKTLTDIYNKENNKGFLMYLSHKSHGVFDLSKVYNYITSIIYNIELVKSSIIKYAEEKNINNDYDLNEIFNLDDYLLKGVVGELNELSNNIYNFLEDISKDLSKIESKENFKNDIRVKILKEKCNFLKNTRDNIEKIIRNQEEEYCYSLQLHKGYKWWSLKITPLEIAGFFHKRVLSEIESGLFISATL
ncbi:ATP-dependent DNA helicase, partial [Clostridium sp.]|uniref:ATP-dependent DNA helicase n=1 Tax=Clostridium sp. TaxID=1506 RepID=UPI003463A376